MRIFCCNQMSLHNSCSVIDKFGLSEGSLGFCFALRGPGLARAVQFRVLSAQASTNVPRCPGLFGALTLMPSAFAVFLGHSPSRIPHSRVLLVHASTKIPCCTDLQKCHVVQCFQCPHLKDPTFYSTLGALIYKISTFKCFQCIHLQTCYVFLYMWCTGLQKALVFQCFCACKNTGTRSHPCTCTEQDPEIHLNFVET